MLTSLLWRKPANLALRLLTFLLCSAAGFALRPAAPADSVDTGLWLALLAVPVFGAALLVQRVPAAESGAEAAASPAPAPGMTGRHWLLVGLGAGLLLALAEINGGALLAGRVASHAQAVLFVAAPLLLVWGAAGGRPRRDNARDVGWRQRLPYAGLLLALLTLLAFLFYLWRIDTALHIWVDEFHFADAILRLWDDPNRALLLPNPGIAAFASTYAYLQNLAVGLFGADLFALRCVSALFGALTVPAVYLLAREVFRQHDSAGQTPAASLPLLAALIFATFPPQMHFSRLGLNNIADPLFGTLALAVLLRALRTGRRLDFALSGVLLGLTQYWYEGGKLLYPALVAAFLLLRGAGQLLSALPLPIARRLWRGESGTTGLSLHGQALRIRFEQALWLPVTALLVALPSLYPVLTGAAGSAAPRLAGMGLLDVYFEPLRTGGIGAFVDSTLKPPLLHFLHSPDGSRFFYGGETGMVLPLLVPLLLLGMAAALWRLKWRGGLLLLLWVLAAVVGNSLIVQRDWTARFVVVFPAVALLLALGLHELLAWAVELARAARGRAGQRRTVQVRMLPALSLLAALVIAVYQVGYYFGEHIPVANAQILFFNDHIDTMYRMRPLPTQTQVYLLLRERNYGLTQQIWGTHFGILSRFWAMQRAVTILLADDTLPGLLTALPGGVPYAFFVEPDDAATIAGLQARFPALSAGAWSPYSVPQDKQYLLFTVTGDE